MSNRLAQESSPYLLQHQDNPVDWYPWGPEALERAKQEQKPVFLSVGYSACHWCHVMEHESFEDAEIADALNEYFVCVKVDREERPDIDQVYMQAVQMMTGRGGWPMSVFLTPDLEPFYAGTYWPPRDARGMPGFDRVVAGVARAWRDTREAATDTAQKITEELKRVSGPGGTAGPLPADFLSNAARLLRGSFDTVHGGFGGAPKFPQAMTLRSLLRHWHRTGDEGSLEMATVTLDRMAGGGMYDHVGGGFARYSVDARWLVPHFEKMLYDNGLLGTAYTEAYQATGNEQYARVVRETLDYVLRDMTDPAGGFYSSEDADSEGVEGKFYTWTPAGVREVLGGEAAELFCRVYDITEGGNFEHGQSIPNLPKTVAQHAELLGRGEQELRNQLAELNRSLFEARERRVHPGKDDKVLTSWNGLMIDAMARAGRALGEDRYTEAAKSAARFILSEMKGADGGLLHSWRHGKAKIGAFLDDYAALADALVTLYECTAEAGFLDQAASLLQQMTERFGCPDGGFFYTAADQEQLISRTVEFADNAVPSGNSLAATALARIAKLTGDAGFLEAARQTVDQAAGIVQQYPSAAGHMMIAADLLQGPTHELVLAGDLAQTGLEAELARAFLPHAVLAYADADPPRCLREVLTGKESPSGEPLLHICEGYTCQAPAEGGEAIRETLTKLAGPGRA